MIFARNLLISVSLVSATLLISIIDPTLQNNKDIIHEAGRRALGGRKMVEDEVEDEDEEEDEGEVEDGDEDEVEDEDEDKDDRRLESSRPRLRRLRMKSRMK